MIFIKHKYIYIMRTILISLITARECCLAPCVKHLCISQLAEFFLITFLLRFLFQYDYFEREKH